MTKKDEFIDYVKNLMNNQKEPLEMNEDARIYWEGLLGIGSNEEKPLFTDNGKLIMKYLQSLPEGTPIMRAKEIAEQMYIASRTISGSMRKLVSDGFVEKIGQNPAMYALTEKGKNITIE